MLLTQKQKFKGDNLNVLVTFQDTWTGAVAVRKVCSVPGKHTRTLSPYPGGTNCICLCTNSAAYVSHITSYMQTLYRSKGLDLRNILRCLLFINFIVRSCYEIVLRYAFLRKTVR